jgi:glutamate-5-semialdehyde dehydrogenase
VGFGGDANVPPCPLVPEGLAGADGAGATSSVAPGGGVVGASGVSGEVAESGRLGSRRCGCPTPMAFGAPVISGPTVGVASVFARAPPVHDARTTRASLHAFTKRTLAQASVAPVRDPVRRASAQARAVVIVAAMDLREELEQCGRRARAAAVTLAPAGRQTKDRALAAMAQGLLDHEAAILEANAIDVADARAAGLDDAMIDRLVLDPSRIRAMVAAVNEIVAADDPVGEVLGMKRRPNGMLAGQVRIPLGVIAMIYESRPNVTIDAAALCLKSGNAILLRGGKEAKRSNEVLGRIAREGLRAAGLPEDAVQVIAPLGREETKVLVGLTGLIDLLIPRGGEGLIRFVAEHARVPVVQHYKGVCHLYVDASADVDMAFALTDNGKMSRPGVCNALECVLVHEAVAPRYLSRLSELVARGLEVRGDDATVGAVPEARRATEDDWGQEFLARVLAVKVVPAFDDALAHIQRYGSQHTEAICTNDHDHAERFLREVDASCVLVNASTRFNDGGQLGLGAEVGISTTKLHAYGPMGLASLTALKWIVQGSGQVR